MLDRSDEVIEAFDRHGFDAMVAIGGDGSLHIANQLCKKGLPVVGVPKTIDNDLAATQVTFGFHTAVQTASEALDKLHSTAESHERVMVVEVMGRHTGWIALFAGVSATADVILIPEIPYRIEEVCKKVEDRDAAGRMFSIVVVAEGARPAEGDTALVEEAQPGERGAVRRDRRAGRAPDHRGHGQGDPLARPGAPAAGRVAHRLRPAHRAALRRRGRPLRRAEESFGTMVALDPPDVRAVPLEEAIRQIKTVPLDSDIVQTARDLGISLGDGGPARLE